jgi:lipoprotein-anchoring transpeptidase ErfK/SrfK
MRRPLLAGRAPPCRAFSLTAILLAAALGALPAAPASAAGEADSTLAVSALAPGRHVWISQEAGEGPVTIVVSLGSQRAFVYRGSTLIGVSTVSSGMPGHETPTGTFNILEKAKEHRSNLYEDAPMPYMQRLTWDGVALHAGKVGAEPASHGCIRLPTAFAKKLFEVTSLGATVVVTDEMLSTPEEASAALALQPDTEVAAAQ